jgi:hypothetical protein
MEPGAVISPRGPLPPGVYWRRRVLLLVAVAAVIGLVAWSCSGGGGKARVGALTSPSATPSARASAKPKPKPVVKPTVTKSVAPSPSVTTPAAPQPCPDSALTIDATANAQSYPAGVLPLLTIAVTNSSGAACTRDIGPGAAELRVLSGPDQVWSSDDCGTAKDSHVVTLQPGIRTVVSKLHWSRHRSAPGCPTPSAEAKAGTYRAVGRLGSAVQVGDTFTLS